MILKRLAALGLLLAALLPLGAQAAPLTPFYDRVAVLSATTGTGTLTLGAAISGPYQSFAGAGVVDGSTVRYAIVDGNAWEIGHGVYAVSGTTLTRTVDKSSASGAAINLDGSETVYLTNDSALDLNQIAAPLFNPVSPNQIWAGPSSGSSAPPLWRAMVSTDLPPFSDNTKTSAYTVLASDIANGLNLGGTGAALTLPAGVFGAGQSLSIFVSASAPWTITNSTGLTLTGLNSTTLPPGTSGTFIANADGTHLDFFPGMQVATTSALGSFFAKTCGAGTFLSALNTDGSSNCGTPAGGGNVSTAGTLTSGQIVIGQGSQSVAVDVNAALSAGVLTLGASGTAGSVVMGNATSGTVTLQPVTGALGSVTASLPANTGTIAELNFAQIWSGAQSFNDGDLKLNGSTSGAGTIHAPATAGTNSYTLPSSGGTLVGSGDTGTVTGTMIASSIALAGSPTTTTQAANDNSTKIATTAYADRLLALPNAFTAGQAVTPDTGTGGGACGTQTAGGTMTVDFSKSNSCVATFGAGNLTVANPTNIKAGQSYIFQLIQDATGGRTVTWGANFKWQGGTAPTLSTAASAKDDISCFAPTTSELDCTLAIKGAA